MGSEPLDVLALELNLLAAAVMRRLVSDLQHRLHAEGVVLSPLGFASLRLLHQGPHTLSELSRMLQLQPATLVPVVSSLERQGFVSRHRDSRDRRCAPIALTPLGSDVWARVCNVEAASLLRIGLEGIGPERAGELLSLLRALVAAMPNGEALLREVAAGVACQTASLRRPHPPPDSCV